MEREPGIAITASLIGDTGRAAMLMALADGRALPAGELASGAGLSASAASGHLSRLVEGGLLAVEREGRHRYYRLASPGVAAILESLAAHAGSPRPAVRSTPHNKALRQARTCYDHLAGELGGRVATALEERGLLLAGADGKRLTLTPAGAAWFEAVLGIDVSGLKPGRHGIACRCLDWTERRHHLAGPLGRRVLGRFCEKGWLARLPRSRALRLTRPGRVGLEELLGITGLPG